MSVETEQQRDEKAIRLAEERGRRQQVVDSRLDEHDRRLAAINGSIERAARAQEHTRAELAGVKAGVATLQASMDKTEAISQALAEAAVSRREFWLGVLAVAAIIVGAIITTGHLP